MSIFFLENFTEMWCIPENPLVVLTQLHRLTCIQNGSKINFDLQSIISDVLMMVFLETT